MDPKLVDAFANLINAGANTLPILITAAATWFGAHYSSKSGAKIATDAAGPDPAPAPAPSPKAPNPTVQTIAPA